MKYVVKILLLIFTFVYIYTPPLTIWPTQIDLFIYLVFIFMVFVEKCNPFNALKVKGIKTSFCFMIVLFLISMLWTIEEPPNKIGFTDLNLVRIARLIIEVVIFPYILVFVCKKKGITQSQMIYALIYLALFQAYVSVLMIFVPVVKDLVTTNVIHFGANNKLAAETLLANRVFGIGSEYLFGLPIFQAMITCVYVSIQEKKNLYFYFNLICLIASAIFCARTSLFVFLGYFIYYYAQYIKNHFVTTIIVVAVFLIIVWNVLQFLLSIEGIAAIDNFNRAFNGEYQGYDLLLDSMLFFPDDLATWMAGNGSYMFFVSGGSDIGYVNDIFYGGIIYLLFEFLSLYTLYKKARKAEVLTNVLPFLFLILLVLHYKGTIYKENDFMKGIFLFYYITFYAKNSITCKFKNNIYIE